MFFAVLVVFAFGFIIIKITNKDGTVTEIKVPKDAKIEVDGKTVTPAPKKSEPNVPEPKSVASGKGVYFKGLIADAPSLGLETQPDSARVCFRVFHPQAGLPPQPGPDKHR